ncbi:MAG TPA: helix-turn-helix domain-containing protein [Pedobacter sp.]|nr:helix-turn-helix domain-containing protein [Pedobacter sp.]
MLTLNLFTIVNLIVLALLMGVRKVNTTANKVLAGIIVLPAFAFFINYLIVIDFIEQMPFLLGFNVSFLWAPFVLWYVKLMLRQEVRMNVGKVFHAIPLLLDIAFGIYVELQPEAYVRELVGNLQKSIFPWQIEALNSMMLVQILSYLGYSFYLVKKWKADNETNVLMSLKLKWLKQFLTVLFVLNILLVLSYTVFTPVEVDYYVVPILYDVFYFWVVYKSFSSSGIFADFKYNINIKEEIASKEKYSGSALKREQVLLYRELLDGYMEARQPYKDPELSLSKLALDTAIPQHHLSQLINQEFGKNFFDFVNVYRIDKAKELMKDKSTGNLTLEAIGAASGFGSATAFYRAFKKHTGITPSNYLKN